MPNHISIAEIARVCEVSYGTAYRWFKPAHTGKRAGIVHAPNKRCMRVLKELGVELPQPKEEK